MDDQVFRVQLVTQFAFMLGSDAPRIGLLLLDARAQGIAVAFDLRQSLAMALLLFKQADARLGLPRLRKPLDACGKRGDLRVLFLNGLLQLKSGCGFAGKALLLVRIALEGQTRIDFLSELRVSDLTHDAQVVAFVHREHRSAFRAFDFAHVAPILLSAARRSNGVPLAAEAARRHAFELRGAL